MRDRKGLPRIVTDQPSGIGHRGRDLFFVNLFWLVALGVAVLIWLSRFTDYLEVAIAVLGFGGVLAWIPFLANLVGEDRKKQLQGRFESVLKGGKTSIILGAATVTLPVMSHCFGCIVIDAREDNSARKVVIRRGSDSQAEAHVSAGSMRRFPVWTGLQGGEYEIDADGLPLVQRIVRPWSRLRLTSPADFLLQNVVLIRADAVQSQTSANPQMRHKIRIQLDEQEMGDFAFAGRPFWIACREEVAIPAPLQEKWRREIMSWLLEQKSNLPSSCVEPILALWFAPDAIEGISELRPGQKLTVTVHPDGASNILAEGSAVIRPCRNAEDFPQVIYLKSASSK